MVGGWRRGAGSGPGCCELVAVELAARVVRLRGDGIGHVGVTKGGYQHLEIHGRLRLAPSLGPKRLSAFDEDAVRWWMAEVIKLVDSDDPTKRLAAKGFCASGIGSSVDLDAHRAVSDLDELDLGNDEHAAAASTPPGPPAARQGPDESVRRRTCIADVGS